MITNVVLEQYYRLLLHEHSQRYATAYFEDNEIHYPHAKNDLTQNEVENSIEGKTSLGVMLIQKTTSKVKAGCIDIDTPRDALNMVEGLALAQKLQETALKLGLTAYIEFSGNRGYHLWIFSDKPVLASVMIDCLKVVAQKADFSAEEIFPNHRSKESKCIKLPGTTHLKSNKRCGFITPQFNPNQPEVDSSNQGQLMAGFNQNEALLIYEVSQLSSSEKIESKTSLSTTEKTAIEDKLNQFGDNHPSCIEHLIHNGVPEDLNYNQYGNTTLSRYCISRGFDLEYSKSLAKAMAKNTSPNHPTSKKTLGAKVNNFRSVFNSAKNNPEDYFWQCTFILQGCGKNGITPKDRGCSGSQCALYTKTLEKLTSPSQLPLNRFIFQSVVNLLSSGKEPCKSQILRECETLIKEYQLSDNKSDIISESRVLLENEFLAGILSNPESVLDFLDIYPSGLKVTTEKKLSDYYDELVGVDLPSPQTLEEYAEIIRQDGIKVEAKSSLSNQLKELDSEDSPLNALTEVIEVSEGLLNKSVNSKELADMTSHIRDLTLDLFQGESPSIPTPSKHLNNILNGGFQNGKLYVIGAPPASGKTTFCSWVGDYASLHKFKVVYCSYEMGRSEMFLNAIARLTGIKSNILAGRKWREPNYPDPSLEEKLKSGIIRFNSEIAPFAYYLECDDSFTPTKLKLVAKKIEADLLIVDYLQLLTTGDEKLDTSNLETIRVSKIATDLKRLARDLDIPVIAISDINKDAYQKSLVGGDLDMGALRDSFKIAHSADAIMLLQSGLISIGKGENKTLKDQLQLIIDKYPEKETAIDELKEAHPLNPHTSDTYSRLTIVKNRGGKLGEPIFLYSKALHNFQPLNLELETVESSEEF